MSKGNKILTALLVSLYVILVVIIFARVSGATSPLQGSTPLLQGGERQTLQVTVNGKTLQGSSPRLQGE